VEISAKHPWPRLAFLALVLASKVLVLRELAGNPSLQPSAGLDGAAYVALAQRVASGDLLAGREVFMVSPLYAWFLAPFLALGDATLWWARLAQVLLGTAAVALVYAAARRLATPSAGIAAAAALALCGVVTFNEVLILQSALDPFLAALALFLLLRALGDGGLARLCIAGAALGLFALNRPNVLLVAAAVSAAIAVCKGASRYRRAAAYAAGVALAIAPVTARNAWVAHDFVPVSAHGGLNFYIGNNPSADGTYKSVPGITPGISGQARDARALAEGAAGRPLRPSQVDAYFYKEAFHWLATFPAAAVKLLVTKLAYVLSRADIALNYSYAFYADEESAVLRFLFAGAALLVPLGAVGLFLAWRTAALALRPWFVVAPAYALSVAVFFVTSRYRLALFVPLAIGTGIVVARLAGWLRAANYRAAALTALGIAGCGVLAWNDHGLDDGWGAEAGEKALLLVASGRDAEAEALLVRLETARVNRAALAPRLAEAYAQRGETALGGGDFAGAEKLLRRAVDADPAAAPAWEQLGLALARLGRLDDARTALTTARDLDPATASAHLNLAVVLGQMGRIDAALGEADEALRLRPDYREALGLRAALRRLL
jgi:tetratricopeptide (TPR) repeat protein